jgi:hypothetical protein
MEKQTFIKLFYSWQSDLPKETNQNAIRSCIKKAFPLIEENFDSVQFIYDEATRGEAGSPDIPSTIFNKISTADIFICDITTINHAEPTNRKTPNPNVLVELGYAISILGWERIIMVFNKCHGKFPSELPFDLDKRRTTNFRITNKTDNDGKSDLTHKLKMAIETIYKKNPSKPFDKNKKNQNEIKREKDLANLNLLMSCIHVPTFDLFLDGLPDRIIGRIFFFWYTFQANYDSSTFYIYEEQLREKLKEFRIYWDNSLSYGQLFHPSANGKYYHLHLPMDVFTNERTEKEYNELSKISVKLRKIFKELITIIKEQYLEIDLEKLSNKAVQNYIDYQKETLDELEPKNE